MTQIANGIELMLKYHAKVRSELVRLRAIEEKVKSRESEQVLEAKQEAAEVASYLERMTPMHEQDETNSLFPRLMDALKRSGEEHTELWQEIGRIQTQHEDFDLVWVPLQHWLGMLATPDAILSIEHFGSAVNAIEEHFLHHFELEEHTVYETALRLLSEDELADIADEMRERRS